MKNTNIDNTNYNRKEELKTFLSEFNDVVDKFSKSLVNKGNGIQKLDTSIEKKKNSITKLNNASEDLLKREDELRALKEMTSIDIKDLEVRKKELDFKDSEVMKMEKEDIDVLVASKKNKLALIDEKMQATTDKLNENKVSIETNEKELKDLEEKRRSEQDSLYKTEAIVKLTDEIKDRLNNEVLEILKRTYEVTEKTQVEEQPKEEVKDDFTVMEYDFNDLNNISLDIEEPALDVTPIMNELMGEETTALNFDEIQIPKEEEISISNDSEDESLAKKLAKEELDFNAFDSSVRSKLSENKEAVLKNIKVLKKHGIPLDLTIKEPDILYMIDSKNLEDLLNIVTTDSDGSGMGFGVEYTYNILNELARTDVDKLIEVYNNEFINVDSKTGLIKLLKDTDENIGDFEYNRNANIEALKLLGVETADSIASTYPEFVNLDNPLFLEALNLFDKDDLVSKMNSDIKIVPKILDYWQNN